MFSRHSFGGGGSPLGGGGCGGGSPSGGGGMPAHSLLMPMQVLYPPEVPAEAGFTKLAR